MTLDFLANLVSGTIEYRKKETFKKIRIDTRILEKGDCFLAIVGKEKDGHDYIEEAMRKKASVIIYSNDHSFSKEVSRIRVSDTKQALFLLASYFLETYRKPVIAITGSNGKTTTKEWISYFLNDHYKVLKCPKNYNNKIGVSLTLLELDDTYDYLLLEFGMNHAKEIEELSLLTHPDLAIITNIGSAHIGNLGSKKKIFEAKKEILAGMDHGVLLVNGKDPFLRKMYNPNIFKVGLDCCVPKQVKTTWEQTTFVLPYKGKEYFFETPSIGRLSLSNLLIAIQLSLFLCTPIEELQRKTKQFSNLPGRLEKTKGKFILIDDSYNASYESAKNICSLLEKEKQSKIFIFGDFLELGKYRKRYHKKINRMLKKIPNKEVLLVGKETKRIRGKHFENNKKLKRYLQKINLQEKIVIVKGSRNMHLEEISQFLKESL